MPAQQKPKQDSKKGQRNGLRRNGKAFSKASEKNGHDNKHLKNDGPVKSIHGYSVKTLLDKAEKAVMAYTQYPTNELIKRKFDMLVDELAIKKAKRLEYRRNTSPQQRRENKAYWERVNRVKMQARAKQAEGAELIKAGTAS